jgi:signal transduction histidine kinase
MLIAFLLYINNRNRSKANDLLQKQKEEIEIQKRNVEKTLSDLKSTQAQLIQSEKMASLGELTAGIAHEIQNPLNFVNNFSEVSAELVDEIQDLRRKTQARATASEEDEILEDIRQNLEKITLHGKRADAIVKGMLEHSKRGSGQKEPTDINALADDFLRLTYQSFLAKDPNFKVELQTNLNPDLPKISVIPQDIGKVLLNLYSNALYAISSVENPIVTVTTTPLQEGRGVKISVSDNGPGIPSSIKDKIFQPFFTTKPTGQGTGLGLSLSYDIAKAHGGELKVNTKENEGTEFILQLPIAS